MQRRFVPGVLKGSSEIKRERRLVHEDRDVALVSTLTIDELDAMKTPVLIGMKRKDTGCSIESEISATRRLKI